METPLYEFDQVITCPELSNIEEQLAAIYSAVPKWRWILRYTLRIQFSTVTELHQALHLKTEALKKQKETSNE